MKYDPGCHILPCTWNPTSGKLYQNFYYPGYIFSDKPTYPNRSYLYGGNEYERIPHHAIFMYLGGPGGKQRCPEHYIAFKILYGEKTGWLIYPEQYTAQEYRPINPIRL